jgi:hypothetical protein
MLIYNALYNRIFKNECGALLVDVLVKKPTRENPVENPVILRAKIFETEFAIYIRNPPRGTVLILSSSADHFSGV